MGYLMSFTMAYPPVGMGEIIYDFHKEILMYLLVCCACKLGEREAPTYTTSGHITAHQHVWILVLSGKFLSVT